MFKKLSKDIDGVKRGDPAARNSFEILLLYSGLHAIMLHRPAHWLYKHKLFFLARLISQFSRFITGIEIHPGATLGRGILIDHGAGVVIGETAEVGDNCIIYQGVTLGGTGKDIGKRHPTLEEDVVVGSGAKVLGPFTVGSGAKIAANAVVLKEIPSNATAVGIPARIVRVNGETICNNKLDHMNMPDPVTDEFTDIEKTIEELKCKIEELEKTLKNK